MCKRDVIIFKDCGHWKSETITPCMHGYNEASQRCNINIHTGTFKNQIKPSYCRKCYCEIEEDIFDMTNDTLLEIRTECQEMNNFQAQSKRLHEAEKEKLKDNPQALEAAILNFEEISADMELWIANWEEQEREAKKGRERDLKCFREEQGVWGDG